jgi:hypothetical protein
MAQAAVPESVFFQVVVGDYPLDFYCMRTKARNKESIS